MTKATIKAGDKIRILTGFRDYHGFADGSIVTAKGVPFGDGYITAEGTVSWRDGVSQQGDQTLKPEHYEAVTAAPELDLTKPVQTKDGRPVVLLTTEGRGEYPVLGYVGDSSSVCTFTASGSYYKGEASSMDLMNVPPALLTKHYYVNVYNDDGVIELGTGKHASRADADLAAKVHSYKNRIGVTKVECIEGKFDA